MTTHRAPRSHPRLSRTTVTLIAGLVWGAAAAVAVAQSSEQAPADESFVSPPTDVSAQSAPAQRTPVYFEGGEQAWLAELVAREPSSEACVQAAVDYLDTSHESLDALLRRARRAHWLPTNLRLAGIYRRDREDEWRYHVDQSFDESDLLDETAIQDRILDQSDNYMEIRVQIEWRLSQLRQADSEVQLRRLDRSYRDDREKLIELVIERYFRRRELQLRYYRFRSRDSMYEATATALEIERETATLDALTGGWFGRSIRAEPRH